MSKQQTVTINGVVYDAHTGLRATAAPATIPAPKKAKKEASATTPRRHTSHQAQTLHVRTHRSKTLNRDHVSTPVASPAKAAPVKRPQVEKSPLISKFAKHPQPAAKPHRVAQDIGPVPHPVMHKVATVQASQPHQSRAASAHAPTPPPAHELKKQAISKAMANAAKTETSLRKKQRRRPGVASIASASLALVLLAGYLTYLNLPTLSVRVAAAQAGIAASYPSYHPQGYRLNGPVAYANGQVTMRFASNTSPQNFQVHQIKSTWDSSALLTNYIEPAVGEEYMAYHDSGLTIYVYGTKAAWVNNGILHTVEGDASLSNDQIRRIATSM